MREHFSDQAILLEKEKEEESTTRIEVNWSLARGELSRAGATLWTRLIWH
jgi:hypothetical protein